MCDMRAELMRQALEIYDLDFAHEVPQSKLNAHDIHASNMHY